MATNLQNSGQDNSAPIGSDFVFLYWDDPGDSQEHVDNQKNG